MAKVNLVVKVTLDITCMRNDTFKLDMDWVDANSNPIDLTLYTFKAQVRKTNRSSSPLITFDDTDFTKDNAGNLLMSKSATSMDVSSGTYTYDLQATLISTGDVATWLGGLFIVQQDITL